MKILISENQLRLIRRIGEIERLIDPTMDGVYSYLQGTYNTPLDKRLYRSFESTVVMKLANELANQTKLTGDEKVTFRNQIQRYVTNEYYSKIKDYFMSRLEKNINESTFDKNSKLIYKMYNDGMDFKEISELTGLSLEQIIFLLKDKKMHINCDFAEKLVKILFNYTDLVNKKHSFDDGTVDLVLNWDTFGGYVIFEYYNPDYMLSGFATPYWNGECRTPVDGGYFEDRESGDYYDDYDNQSFQTSYTPKDFKSISELIDFLNNEYPKLLIDPINKLIHYYENKYK
jgi:transposase-like protein